MNDKKASIEKALDESYFYPDYIALIHRLHQEKKATSFQGDETFFNYSLLSLRRMERIYKRAEIPAEIVALLERLDRPLTWMLITESWCGDASQTVPLIARLSELSDSINLRIVLRDSHPDLMEHFLTNGGKSIPILVLLDAENNEIGRWGPRPAPAQQMLSDYKAIPEAERPPYSELSTALQKWYNSDKGNTTFDELKGIFDLSIT